MKEIKLINSTEVALIDDEDYKKLVCWEWKLFKGRNTNYAICGHYPNTTWMHIDILGFVEGFQIDHKDRNGLNNQKYNLRYATHSQNNANALKRITNTSGYKGVTFHKNGYYQAQIGYQGEKYYLGVFESPIDAASAYDKAAKRLQGEFAVLNFPSSSTSSGSESSGSSGSPSGFIH